LISAAVLNLAYRNARDADVRERILLITRVRLDNNEASSVAEKEFHRSRWWAYKCINKDLKKTLIFCNEPRNTLTLDAAKFMVDLWS
jgi:hypothetical protein